ncbi:MAG TPA: phosphoribosyltransferase [Chthoniobacter sp.]|nr:phosphoribosyltransferase [Chthoniobacter sp.]
MSAPSHDRFFFRHRRDAGWQLAGRLLSHFGGWDDVLVLGLARGGVPVAFEVAHALHLPLDVIIVRKLGVPGHRELAMGAIASGGVRVLNETVLRHIANADAVVEEVAAGEKRELERREVEYRGDRPPLAVREKVVLVVDDGLATGASMRAAVLALRQREAARVIVAVPVGSSESCARLAATADEVICLYTPTAFGAVGELYEDFSQTSDEEVRTLLAAANSPVR